MFYNSVLLYQLLTDLPPKYCATAYTVPRRLLISPFTEAPTVTAGLKYPPLIDANNFTKMAAVKPIVNDTLVRLCAPLAVAPDPIGIAEIIKTKTKVANTSAMTARQK